LGCRCLVSWRAGDGEGGNWDKDVKNGKEVEDGDVQEVKQWRRKE